MMTVILTCFLSLFIYHHFSLKSTVKMHNIYETKEPGMLLPSGCNENRKSGTLKWFTLQTDQEKLSDSTTKNCTNVKH